MIDVCAECSVGCASTGSDELYTGLYEVCEGGLYAGSFVQDVHVERLR